MAEKNTLLGYEKGARKGEKDHHPAGTYAHSENIPGL